MIKKFFSRFPSKPFAFKTKSCHFFCIFSLINTFPLDFSNCTNQKHKFPKNCTLFSRIAANHNLKKEAYERELSSKKDIENCLETIKSYKPSAEFLQRHLSPSYNPINIDNLLVRLKERKALCIKGSYGYF